MTEREKTRLRRLWDAIAKEMSSFETGGGWDTGFYHLPSGRPMSEWTVRKRFAKIESLAAKANCKRRP